MDIQKYLRFKTKKAGQYTKKSRQSKQQGTKNEQDDRCMTKSIGYNNKCK